MYGNGHDCEEVVELVTSEESGGVWGEPMGIAK